MRRTAIPVQQGRQGQLQQAQAGLLKSSLDIVWSYSRSQAFFGSNLPSSPSFVQRYHRFGAVDESDTEEEAREQNNGNNRGAADTTTEDDEDEEYDEDEDEGDEEEWVTGLDSGGGSGEPLPWNASTSQQARAGKGRRRSSTRQRHKVMPMLRSTAVDNRLPPDTSLPATLPGFAQRDSAASSVPVTPPSMDDEQALVTPPPLSERTPLLHKQLGLEILDVPNPDTRLYASSPPDQVPFPRRSTQLKGGRRKSSNARRLSVNVARQGLSTSGQTLFNAINVLVGVGILAEPLAFSQAGWVLGVTLLLFYSALTNYTAKILARALRDDARLMTYADIGAKAFGGRARTFINLLFCLEISALCVALLILLGDSLSILLPLPPNAFKLIGFAIIFPTLFLPLRYLSIASLIGITSVVTLTITVFIDGCLAHTTPGSLRHPMPTSIGPNWRELPLAFGLIMSGFGGHAVFPSLARDIRDPKDFNRVCDLAFLISTAFYLFMGTIGYLMFGNTVTDEVTRNVLRTPGLPRVLNIIAVCMVAVTPVCKYSISSTPLESTISWLLGVEEPSSRLLVNSGSSIKSSEESAVPGSGSYFSSGHDRSGSTARAVQSSSEPNRSSIIQPLADIKPQKKVVVRQIVKVITSVSILGIAIFVPSFDRVMGLLGAFSVFLICAIGPLAANLALHRRYMSRLNICSDVVLLLVSVAMAVSGTVAVFLPKQSQAV